MQILLANAKIMFCKADRKPVSAPLFQTVADTLAAEMARMDVEDLARQLKDRLTDELIDSVKADDGILLHLSTEEYEHLFDWRRVCKEVTVVQPLFYVRQKDGRLKMQAVWAKSCRGAMVCFILNNRLVSPEGLSAFSYEGFEYAPQLGDASNPYFVR